MPYGMMNAINQVKTNNSIERANNAVQRVYNLQKKLRIMTESRDDLLKDALYLAESKVALENLFEDLMGNRKSPTNDRLQRNRIAKLTNAIHGNLSELTISQKRHRILDVIVWADYIYLTEFYLFKKIDRVVSETLKNNMINDDDMRSVVHNGMLINEARNDPEAWVANRKNQLLKTVKYQTGKDVVPIYASFGPSEVVASEMKENVLQFEGADGEKGLFDILNNNIIRLLM